MTVSRPAAIYRVLAAFLIVLLVGQPAAYSATESQQSEARALFEKARRQYEVGQFEEALDNFSLAYERAPLPGFLFNIGQCHRNLGHPQRATFAFRQYLRLAPDAPDRAAVEKLIQDLESERKAKASAVVTQTSTMAVASPPMPPIPLPIVPPQEPSNGMQTGLTYAPDPELEQDTPVYERWWFWTAIAVGAAAVVGGTIAATSGGTNVPDGDVVLRYDEQLSR
jgi:tetratricopeptide (TPR) repeat protein